MPGFRLFAGIKKRFADMPISSKILLFSFTVLVFSVFLSTSLYGNIYNSTISGKISQVSLQTLYSINSNIDSMIENSKNLNKVILSSEEIQGALRSINAPSADAGEGNTGPDTIISPDLEAENTINTNISKFIEAFPFISSIYIFDTNSQRYGIDKMPLKSLNVEDISEAGWYPDAVAAKGGYILRLNAGNVFTDTAGERYVSLIRVINDIYTQKPIGTLILNISCESFADSYQEIINKYDTDIMIVDGDGNTIVDFKNPLVSDAMDYLLSDGENGSLKKLNGREYLISRLDLPEYGWTIVSIMPFAEFSKESSIFNVTALAIIALNSFLLFLGSLLVSRMITLPIKKLLNSMKGVEKGDFTKVDIAAGNDEIGKLRDGYNIMITEIQQLIKRVVEDQKIQRKAELDVLQAQVKPHFLYNTFDAISALAFAGRNDEVYRVMKALGNYYRVSLSKGSEVITIAEEIDVVRNYLTIQQVRYGDIFRAHYDIDEGLARHRILKLVLQPLVENALYHGIKSKGELGNIYISVKPGDGYVVLTVEDDGVGMDQALIDRILDGTYDNEDKTGFGLGGTIERLRIFYGMDAPVTIESSRDSGTRIRIYVPMEED